MGHVEDPGLVADGAVLGDDSLVLQRHVPAGELGHPGPEAAVRLEKRCVPAGHSQATPEPPAATDLASFGPLRTMTL